MSLNINTNNFKNDVFFIKKESVKHKSFSKSFFNFFNLKKHVGKCVGKQLFKVTVDTSQLEKNRIIKQQLIQKNKASSFRIHQGEAKNHGELDGVILFSEPRSEKYILVFNGKNDCYDNHIHSLQQLAQDTGANIVTFDYRGIQGSKGTLHSKKSVLKDGASVMHYLTDHKKIEASNILFYGHSLGGGIAAELHKQLNHQGALVSEASFSSLTSVIKERGGILSRMVAFIVNFSNWNFNAVVPFNEATKKAIFFNRRDPLVRYPASLYKTVKKTSSFSSSKVGKGPKKDELSADWTQVKKNKSLQKKFPHPHHRTMDRLAHLLEVTQDKNMEDFRAKLLLEDSEAYKKQVAILKSLL